MLQFTQKSFEGGINLLKDDSAIAENQIVFGANIRTRYGVVATIKSPLELVNAPRGRKQGLYGVGNILLMFVEGFAFYKLPSASTWTVIPDLYLSPTVSRIYGCLVPQTTLDYSRKLAVDSEIGSGVKLSSITALPIPSGFICQDGINQPWIIFADGTARKLGNYSSWTTLNKEYVPIGKQMIFHSGILYIVSSDGKLIYRSVSGRPIDFVVNIDINGDKGGDATTTSIGVDFNTINCIQALNAQAIFVGTSYNCYLIEPDFTKTIFAEPTYKTTFLFSTGVVNQVSFVENLGDFSFIDWNGLRSINAVTQLKFEGRNSLFSSIIAQAFEGITQDDNCCAIDFDNYSLFSVKTIYGDVTLVYDSITKTYSSFDSGIASGIKQFAVITDAITTKLYGITPTKAFEIYGGVAFEIPIIQTKAWTTDQEDSKTINQIVEHKSSSLNLVFSDASETGLVYATEYIDAQIGVTRSRELIGIPGGVLFPVIYPVTPSSFRSMDPIAFTTFGRAGVKVGYIITWDNDAKLNSFQISTAPITSITPDKQKTKMLT